MIPTKKKRALTQPLRLSRLGVSSWFLWFSLGELFLDICFSFAEVQDSVDESDDEGMADFLEVAATIPDSIAVPYG